jgi:hypothetical protein
MKNTELFSSIAELKAIYFPSEVVMATSGYITAIYRERNET